MAQTLLTEIQEFCEEYKLPVPATIIGNSDPNVQQLKAMLYRAGNEIAIRGDWSALTFECTHTTLAQEDQGVIYTITAGTGNLTPFRKFRNETMWDRTDQQHVLPINPIKWQELKALTSVSPRFKYRLRNQRLLFTPTPPAGHTVAFEWLSKWWIQDGTSGAIKERFDADTNSFLIEREILKLGLTWRWKKAKGFDYAEEWQQVEDRIAETLAHDTPRGVLDMGQTRQTMKPGIGIPDYNWMQ